MKIKSLVCLFMALCLVVSLASIACADDSTSLVVASYNIDVKAKQYVTPDQMQLMADNGVEIFGIQEVDRLITRFDIDAYDPLVDFTKDPYVDSYYGMTIQKGAGQYGNAVISAYEIIEGSTCRLYGIEEAPADVQAQFDEIYANYDAGSEKGAEAMKLIFGPGGLVAQGAVEPRVYARAVIEKDGKQIAFYSTHLSYTPQEMRSKQIEQLVEALNKDPVEYKILVGDFNIDTGINEYYAFTNAGYKICNGNNGIWQETFPEKDEARLSLDASMSINFLDNIIVSDNIEINQVNVIHSKLSDHYPIIAELTLN